MKTKLITIEKIALDESLYPRNQKGGDWQLVYRYQKDMDAGSIFPPIVVAQTSGGYILVDGLHRMKAMKNLKQTHIQAEILIGLDKKQIFVEAVKRNLVHGASLTFQERLMSASQLKQFGFTIEQAGQIVMMKTGELKKKMAERILKTVSGQIVVSKSPFAHMNNQTEIPDDFNDMQNASYARSQYSLVHQLVLILENKLLNKDEKGIMEELEKLKKLLDAYQK